MNRTSFGVSMVWLCAVVAGCSSTPTKPTAPVENAAPVSVAAPPAAAAQPVETATTMSSALPAYLDPNNPISTERSVYFDFDDAALKDQYTPLVERQGKYLATNPALKVKVEGNTDERGSSEYNLALGQRRAESLVKGLKIYGVKDAQLEPVSWGKEHASTTGHDEAVWSQDRRADIVYPKQ
jgi:peptidoglycan-associated lipoprotein